MGASSYQSYLSVLQTHSIYKPKASIKSYGKSIIKEISSLERVDEDAYDTNFNLYKLDNTFLKLVQLVLMYKDYFNLKKSFVIRKVAYKDLKCCFNDLNLNVNLNLLVFGRYHKSKCVNRKLAKNKDTSIPSNLMIILKKPRGQVIPTRGDIFFK
jgi:hypothetical protein